MKISLNWLKDFIQLSETPEEIAALLTSTGLEVDGIETIEAIKGGLQGLVIGEVLTCQKHPDADKLSLTTVAIGTNQIVPIVCGAPNVAVGQKVIVATVGAKLFPISGEPFVIKKAKIRGEASEGMICAEDEIGLGNSHAGIMVLDTSLANGTPATQYFGLEADCQIEIGLTPNRADATSHWGVARDLKAKLGRLITMPIIPELQVIHNQHAIAVAVEASNACPRFCGVAIDGVSVQPSPEWLQKRLRVIGINPINNIVDITNYVCHELGQPLHAYDWHAIKGQKIIVKFAENESKFTTLDKEERTLTANDLVVCNAQEPMGIAGVFGGISSGIQENTTRIYLECAYFDAATIRKTAQQHGLKTDASFRFERGTDPNAKRLALERAANLVLELAGGQITSEVLDFYPNPVHSLEIRITYKYINTLIGKTLEKEIIETILNRLDIECRCDETGFIAIVPPYRVDVLRPADIVEEILRIYGLDNVELSPYLGTSFLANSPTKDKEKIQFQLSQLLAGASWQEIYTNSLTKPAYNQAIWTESLGENVEILNKLSEDLAVMRQSLLFSGLEVVTHNVNRRQKDLCLFEFGKTYHKIADKYIEKKHLALFFTGQPLAESWQRKNQAVAFHDLYNMVLKVLGKLNVRNIEVKESTSTALAYGLVVLANKKELVHFGQVQNSHLKKAGVKQPVFFADFDWDILLKITKSDVNYQEVAKYPEVRRDLSLVLDKTISFEQIRQLALRQEKSLLKQINVFDVYEGENLGGKKSYSVSFMLQDAELTLTDQQIDRTMERLIGAFERELHAIIRK